MFSSNDTAIGEFSKAVELGAIINLDDISFIEAILDKATGKSKDDPVIKNEAPEESAEQEK